MLLLVSGGMKAQAQREVSVDRFDAPVATNSRLTYLDLIRKVFPDVQAEGDQVGAQAGKTIALRHLFGDYRERIFEGEMNINSTSVLRIRNSGEEQLLLLLNVSGADAALFQWGGMSVLALFSIERGVTLLDAVDVQADRFTFFAERQAVLGIHPRHDAVLLVNHHFNSGDSYLAYSLVSVVNNRLKDVFAEMPLLVGDNHCGTNFTETPHFKVLRDSRSGYRRLRLSIKLLKKADDANCERRTKGYTKYFNYTLVWQPSLKRYVAGESATKRLRRADKALGLPT
jgi:hypothetical protein